MAAESFRIVVISTVLPLIEQIVPAVRRLGHDVVAVLAARQPVGRPPEPLPPLSDANVPSDLDLLMAKDKLSIEPLLRAYEPDVVLCWGFPWKIPGAALAVPRLGAVNCHPAPLPRHRGPVPFAWALREDIGEFGMTWHRMDADLDTGAILAQARVAILDDDTTIEEIGPRTSAAALVLLPRVLDAVAAGDAGRPQRHEDATWAGHFGEDYALVDWSRTARETHNQVRAWALTFGLAAVPGPLAELDGRQVKLLRTSLVERADAVARVDCADAPLWILAYEPLDAG